MTIEEKARAYDEAIKRAKDSFNYPSYPGFIRADVVFPELKKDIEDEKIREALIDYFDDANKADENPLQSYGIHTDKAIAWLEEQGDKKPVIEGTFVNVDEVREDFMKEVYRFLDDDSNNDRANQIIDAFDNLPTIDF